MKKLALLLAAGLLVGADAKDDDAKKDLELLQGTWALVSAERDGKKAPEDEVKKTRLVVTGNKFKFSADPSGVGTAAEGTFTVDPSKKPKQTDSTAGAGADKGKVSLGIYETDGVTQKICFAAPGKDRPKEFAAPAGSGITLQVWKKEKK